MKLAKLQAARVHTEPDDKVKATPNSFPSKDVLVADRRDGVSGEEKLPEGESTSHTHPLAEAARAAAAAPLPPSVDSPEVAMPDGGGAEEKLPDGESTFHSPPPAVAAAVASAAADVDPGGDTHVVGFEGARNNVVVVAKKRTTQLWLYGEAGNAVVEWMYKIFMVTPITTVAGSLSACAIVVTLAFEIDDKRWYWLYVAGGVWVWLNMLSSRSPELLRLLLSNFDALFNIGNFLGGSLCLCASFEFDERAAAFLLMMVPTFAVIVLGDSTMSDFEFNLRQYFLLFIFVGTIVLFVMLLGHVMKDVENIAVAWGTDGIWLTNAEAIAYANTTSADGDAPWDVTRHTYLLSVAAARFALSGAYVFIIYWISITNPDECSILRNSARRTVGGSSFTLDKQSRIFRGASYGGSPIWGSPKGLREENKAPLASDSRAPPASDIESTGNRSRRKHPSFVESTGKVKFDALELDETSEKNIETLREDEEVMALMPAKEFLISHGPKRTVLHWLCRNATTTMKINDCLEGVKAISSNLVGLSTLVALLALTEVIPYELAWVAILAFPDALRKIFKLNAEAMGLVLRELDFWIPFVTMCLSATFGAASFEYDGPAVLFSMNCVLLYTGNVLFGRPAPAPARRGAIHACIHMASTIILSTYSSLNDHASMHTSLAADTDLAKRVIKNKKASAPKYIIMFLVLTVYTILLTFGLFPRANNHKYEFNLLYNKGAVEVGSMFTQLVFTPLLFLCKFTIKSLVYKGRTVIIKMPLTRHVMPKRELHDFLRRRGEVSRQNSSSSTTPGPASSLSRTSESPTPASPELGPRAAA